MLNRESV